MKKYLKKKITIAPSWGKVNIINRNLLNILEILLNKDYVINLRPHIQSLKYDSKILNEIENKFNENPNFKIRERKFQFSRGS